MEDRTSEPSTKPPCPPHDWRAAEGDRLDGDGFIILICARCGQHSKKKKLHRHRKAHVAKRHHG